MNKALDRIIQITLVVGAILLVALLLQKGIDMGAFIDGKSVKGTANNGIKTALSGVATTNARAAAKANDISFQAMNQAMNFNAAMANNANKVTQALQAQQQAFNQTQTEAANKLSQEYWKSTAKYNSEEAQKNRDWQEYMSSTAYQRAVEDLRKAGLNPILAAMNGGAFTGAGSAATMSNLQGLSSSSGMGNGANASISGFSGQMENTSNQLALFGAIYDGIQGLISSASDSGLFASLKDAADSIADAGKGFMQRLGFDKDYTKENNPNSSVYKENKRNASKLRTR